MTQKLAGLNVLVAGDGKPEDNAALGSFLLSYDAGYITGQVIAADGGLTMRP